MVSRRATAIAAIVALAPAAAAQASGYGQCGGQGWSGTTTCVSGYTCVVQNPYYSQCVPGSGTASTTPVKTTTTTSSKPTTSPSTTSTKTTSTVTTTSTAPTGSSTPVDTKSHCGQYDMVTAGPYTLNTDLWGESDASSGSQCVHLVSLTGSTVAFGTNWTWTGGTSVKSYANIQLNQGINKVLSTISTIPSTFTWSQTTSGSIVADVAYDLFTSTSPGGSTQNNYEIMIWLANFNAGPISYNYGSDGSPTPVASNLSIAGHTWNLYYGFNGWNYVYSFLPVSGTIPSFSGDINLFLKYLTSKETLPASQYLITLEAGTEATSGSATLSVSAYSATIN